MSTYTRNLESILSLTFSGTDLVRLGLLLICGCLRGLDLLAQEVLSTLQRKVHLARLRRWRERCIVLALSHLQYVTCLKHAPMQSPTALGPFKETVVSSSKTYGNVQTTPAAAKAINQLVTAWLPVLVKAVVLRQRAGTSMRSRTFFGFLRCTFFGLNLGRNRSQFSCASSGSFASSRLIMSVLI